MVKHDPKLWDIPFIFYSSVYVSQHDEQFALRMGARAFIFKPKGREEFWIEVCKALLGPKPTFPPPKSQTLDHSEFVSEHRMVVGLKQAENAKKSRNDGA